MKLSIRNFGPVKEADLSLNKLNVLIGDNNSGKTYISYLLFGVLDDYMNRSEGYYSLGDQLPDLKLIKGTNRAIGSILFDNKFIFSDEESDLMIDEINYIPLKDFIEGLFNDKGNDLLNQNTKIDYLVELSDLRFIKTVFYDNLKIILEKIELRENELEVSVQIESNVKVTNKQINLINEIYISILDSLAFKPYIFTAERLGISLFYKELDATRNALIQELQQHISGKTKKIDPYELVRKSSAFYALPIKENIDFTRGIESYQPLKPEIDTTYILELFETLAGGKYKKNANDEIHFISEKPEKSFDVPLYLASSAARGLSDLYFYVKHLAKPNDIVIIDEPESHLTLNKQRIMAKLLVALANAGVKVWVTTHSDFMLGELNNLIRLSADFDKKQSFLEKYSSDYTEKDSLKPEDFNLYSLEEGILKQVPVTEKGISDNIFDDTIIRVNTIAADLEYYGSTSK